MAELPDRTIQLVLHYDGAGFSGWQRQPDRRTVQGVLEDALSRLCDRPVRATGSGRTDAGVHARGQAVGAIVPAAWEPARLHRALNAVLPPDVWVAAAHEMHLEFNARRSAVSRLYHYVVGLDDESRSPFRRRYELSFPHLLERPALDSAAATVVGDHCFRAFAVAGTAPAEDDHRCRVASARWTDRREGAVVVFEIEANRFLHHMVRFLVGTMLDVATGRRPAGDLPRLLAAAENSEVSAPAPPHALFLERVTYPEELYRNP